jgi:hypothetical protein
MLGKLFSAATQIVTIPLDVVNVGVDTLSGGTGDKHSRSHTPILGPLENVRDNIAGTFERLDE